MTVHDATMLAVDPNRPRVSAGQLACPHCGQTYTAIIGEGVSLPPRHYPHPVDHVNGRRVRPPRVASYNRNSVKACPVDGDELVRLLFMAQLDAEAGR